MLDMKEFGKLKGRMAKAYLEENDGAIAKAWEDYYFFTENMEPPYPQVMPNFNPKKYPYAFIEVKAK